MIEDNIDLYKMTLHQRTTVDELTEVLRVPGGWVYINLAHGNQVFVPINYDFMDARTGCEKPT